MMSTKIDTGALSTKYYAGDEDAREQLFANLFNSHYHGPQTSPEPLAENLTALIKSLDLLPPVDPVGNGKQNDLSTALQETYGGMYSFCLSTPPGLDYAWNTIMSFISTLCTITLRQQQVNATEIAISELKWWISEYASGAPACDMRDAGDGALANPNDTTILAVTAQQWQQDPTSQLAQLALNRKARKDHVVNRIIAGRALRDGYAAASPTRNLFAGAFELRFVEVALLREGGRPLFDGPFRGSADVVAATFLLRSCARSLLDCFPGEGAWFDGPMQLAPLKAGLEGREERLRWWREGLEAFIVGQQSQSHASSFAVAAYAAMALENLKSPRDESIESLLAFDNIVF